MEKNFDFVNNGYTGEGVIARGFEIYDEWMEKHFSSRKIVSFVERAVIASQEKRTLLSCTEALSCLFSLDLRVNEKYDTFLKCLFFYFSWRRETNALKRLKFSFHIEEGADIRSAIEIELQRLRESLEDKEADDGDDETRGGKRNGKAEEEAVTEEKGKEQAAEEKAEEAAEAEETEEGKEAPEEKTNDSPEQAQTDEQINHESGDKRQDAETSQETPEEVVQDEKEPLKEETTTELKEENNGPDEKSEPSADKKEKAKVYHDTVDSSPIYESAVQNKPTSDKVSFIDEVIMDNMIKGKEDYLAHNPLADVKRDGKETQTQDIVINREAESKSTDKDAYLYDKTLANDKGNAQQNDKVETKQEPQKVEAKEQKESTQISDNV